MVESAEDLTAPIWWWVVLILIAVISFWSQATVTEERFVPALNVIANEYNIPSDIAGATLMAAGASSPELFSSIVALFITHSALGLGTIVGSEIFNQLIICAGAVYASRTGKLQLDRAIVTREVGFYGLAILLLYLALQDRHPADDDELDDDHIFISFFDACLVFVGYIAYVAVCAKMDSIVALLSKSEETAPMVEQDGDKRQMYGSLEKRYSKRSSFNFPDMKFIREAFGDEPADNFSTRDKALLTTPSGIALEHRDSSGSFNSLPESLRKYSDGRSLRKFLFKVEEEKPSDEHDIHDIEFNAKEGRLSCFMWQRSFFYNKALFGMQAWHLRWFSFTKGHLRSVPDRANAKQHRLTYPKFKQFEFDDKRLIIRLPNVGSRRRREFYFMAPSEEIFDAVVDKLDGLIKQWEAESPEDALSEVSDEIGSEEKFEGSESHVNLLDPPDGGSIVSIILFFFLYPLRLSMQYTIRDVRYLDKEGNPTASLTTTYFSIFMCIVWLIIGSYAMVASLEALAELMDIPDAVVGVTVSAAGTSLPNYVASKVAAQKGFGNMAVSNAFGSNTFNIMIGLGLPWVLYIASTGFRPYHALHDDGITMSVIILGTVLAMFLVLVIPTGFVLYRWHGTLFIALYIAYLTYAIGQVYW